MTYTECRQPRDADITLHATPRASVCYPRRAAESWRDRNDSGPRRAGTKTAADPASRPLDQQPPKRIQALTRPGLARLRGEKGDAAREREHRRTPPGTGAETSRRRVVRPNEA